MTSEWIAIVAALGAKASIVVAIFLGIRLVLVGLAVVVGIFHSNEDRRADARKVLKRLLPYSRRQRSASHAARTLPPSGADGLPREQVSSVRQRS
jgi:hypothetical protein